MHFPGKAKKINSYRDIHLDGKCNDKNDVKVSEKGSLGGEGGEEEADEGDAAEVRGGQAEQAKKRLHCSHLLLWSNLCLQPQK